MTMTTILTFLPHHRFSGTATLRLLLAAAMLLGGALSVQAQTTFAWISTNTNNNSLVTAGNYSPSTGVASDGNANGVFVFGRSNTTTTNLVTTSGDFKLLTLQFEAAAQTGFVLSNSSKFLFEGATRSIIQGSSFSNNVRGGIKIANGVLTLGGNGTGIMVLSPGATADDFGVNGLLKTGSSSFFLDRAFANTVTISNGTLAYRTNNAIGQIQLRGGVLATTGTFSRALGTGAANVNFGAGGGGFAAYGGALTVSTAFATWGGANALPTNAPLILGSAIANNVVTLSGTNNLGAAGTREIRLVDNTNSSADAAVISGVISGAANLQVTGAGILSLTATNTYGGTNFIGGGTVRATTLANAGTSSSLGTNASIVITNGGVLEYVGTTNTSMNRVINLASGNGGIGVSNSAVALTIAGAISNSGSLVKSGAGTLILSASNSYTGATTISGGTLLLSNAGTISTNTLDLAASGATLNISNITAATVNVAALSGVAGSTVSMGAKNMSFGGNNASTTFAGVVTGSGNLTKNGTGTTTLSGANTYTGSAIVSAGTLQLNNSIGSALGSITNLSVATNAVLLVSQSNQVNNASAVSLSGGTIRTPAGISETFGNLSVTGSGTLDFGATFGNASSMNFGTYTPSALLTLNNFNFGSTLTFKTDLTSSITNSSFFTFNNGGISSFNWNAGTSTFTITAIPEPSTYLAAAGLLGLMLWPSRRRIIRDAKKILGLRAPMRDRLAALRDS
jgi:autotransporter-associated beta strand protein